MTTYLKLEERDKKSLECPICKDFLVVPKVTRCNHVFCEVCLTNYIESHTENCPPCPVCRQRIVVPQKGIKAFRTESFYQDLIERLATVDDKTTYSKIDACDICKDITELETKCFTCALVICKACTRAHTFLKPNCTIIQLSEIHNYDEDELMSKRNVVCQNHPDESLKLYCLKCDEPVCIICKLTNHSSHKCESLESQATYCRDWLKNVQIELGEMILEAGSVKTNINTIMENFLREVEAVEHHVNDTIDQLIRQINRKRDTFLRSVNDKRTDVKARFQRQTEKAERIELEGTALKEIAGKSYLYGTDVDVTPIKTDLSKQIENLQRQMYSTLDKDFKMNVHFEEFPVENLKKAIDDYDVGVMECSQQLAVKSFIDTELSPDISRVAHLEMASDGDKLFLVFQEYQSLLRWRYGEMCYFDNPNERRADRCSEDCIATSGILHTTVSSNEDGDILAYHNASGVLRNMNDGVQEHLNIKKDAFPYNYFYGIFALMGKDEYIMFEQWDQCIHRLSSDREIIQVIDNEYTKGIQLGIATNRDKEILLVGQLKDGRGHCTILNPDGSLKFRRVFDGGYSELPIQNSYGCFDNTGNILMRTESMKTKKRALWLMSPSKQNEEKLNLPWLSNGDIPVLSGVCHKCDALLYLTVNKGSKILTVSYLP